MREKLLNAQKYLKQHDIEGWLLYDFQKLNPFALEFLEIPEKNLITRRFFFFIPKTGEPVKIVSKIEPNILSHLPGETITYQSIDSLKTTLESVLENLSSVAMEYSPMCDIPYLSKIDAGIYELVKSLGVDVISSANILQYFSSTLNEEQIRSHKNSASFLVQTVENAFEFIKSALTNNKQISEYDVQSFVHEEFDKRGFYTDHDVICAFGKNTADPHYCPQKSSALKLENDQLILLDIFGKEKKPKSIYSDICFMGYTGSKLPQKIQETLDLVKSAQDEALAFISDRLEEKRLVRGFEVDEICRNVIKSKGFSDYFIHRTGHNLHMQLHGPGAHLDSFETVDDRPLIENTAFTIEPGIYFQGEFGIRLEIDVLIHDGKLEVTTPMKNIINYLI